MSPNSFKYENDISGIHGYMSNLNNHFDTTSIQILTAANVNTGVTKTGTFVNADKYSSVMLYVDSSSVTTVAAGMTGLEVSFYTRANSAAAWGLVATQSGIGAEATTLLKVRGTGLTASGLLPLRDIKVLFKNVSSSATATINAYLMMKGS